MSDKQPRNFWEAAFSPDRDFIIVFLIMLLVTTLTGNFIYDLLSDADNLTAGERIIVVALILFLLLIAGFIWKQRKVRFIPFHVNESNQLKPSIAVIAIPSSPGAIGKIIRFHSGSLRHIWLVGDENLDANYAKCQQDLKDFGVEFHRVKVGVNEVSTTIFDGYRLAVQSALALGIPKNQITVDITGGKKPMTIQAFLLGLELGLEVSYVDSNYEQIVGNDEIKRANEEFQVGRFDTSFSPSVSILSQQYDGIST